MIRIFIAEDEPLILRDISELIPKIDEVFFVAKRCTNGKQVLDALENEIPEVLITDIQMPVVSGLEIIAHIVSHKLPILCLILTGYKEFEYAKRAIDLNVYRYLLKPVDECELSGILTELKRTVFSLEFKNKRREYFSLRESECICVKKRLIANVEKYILENLHRNINQQVLAEQFNYVAPYISRVFKEYKGLSPTQFIIKCRVDKVKTVLAQNPDLPIKAVSDLVGIDDPLYLSKVFKKETGISISEYKDRM